MYQVVCTMLMEQAATNLKSKLQMETLALTNTFANHMSTVADLWTKDNYMSQKDVKGDA